MTQLEIRKGDATAPAVHMPRIGCGLAGGTWDRVGPIVEEQLASHGIRTVVYDFGG